MTFFNEIDPHAAAWTRELMKTGLVTEGVVDERSIEDIAPTDLVGYGRAHWFGGIAVWDYALQLASFPANREVWTASCPCQPFSSAGKGCGFDDERHLWPALFWLLAERRPELCFGEQVASPDGYAWLDLVCADLEGIGYTVGAVVTPAAGFGAPHCRHRIYWVAKRGGAVGQADREEQRFGPRNANAGGGAEGIRAEEDGRGPAACCVAHRGVEHAICERRNRRARAPGREPVERTAAAGRGEDGSVSCTVGVVLDDADSAGREQQRGSVPDGSEHAVAERPGATNGFWGNAIWLPCSDGKERAVEPGALPLAHGSAGELGLVRLASRPDRPHEERIIHAPIIQKGKARAMRLRGYGNAIVAPQAAAFIRAYLETEGGRA